MSQRRKSWAEKLNIDKAAKTVTLERDYAGARAGTRMLVATPRLVEQYIRAIPFRQTRSVAHMRQDLAQAHGCAVACPTSSAIFVRIAAEAAWDQLLAGAPDTTITPFWRLIDPGSPIAKRLRVDAEWLRVKRDAEAGV